ncbi:hypothetical protein [Pseudochrobactrum sp. HB0163]|uniref:hypothetical protein n=1 Tax=Pseudochrobactrum sp. HB0163 TaxID=3450708 RepID=UPI003F6E0E7F
MADTIDILSDFPGWASEFDLFYRQELSRTAGGTTLTRDLGRPLWKAAYITRVLRPNELDYWKARFKPLDGALQPFAGRPAGRCFPVAYPNGEGLGDVSAVKIAEIRPDNCTVTLNGLPDGYRASIGDYVQVASHLYQVAGVEGNMLRLFPQLYPGTAAGNAVVLIRPSVPMIILPGTFTAQADPATGRGTISFQAIEC